MKECNCGEPAEKILKFNSSEMSVCMDCFVEMSEWFEKIFEEESK